MCDAAAARRRLGVSHASRPAGCRMEKRVFRASRPAGCRIEIRAFRIILTVVLTATRFTSGMALRGAPAK